MKISFSGAQALENARANEFRHWVGGKAGFSAAERLVADGPIQIDHAPKFKLTKEMPVFTMGSCFAREVENVLAGLGVPLLLKGHGVEAKFYESWNEQTQTGGGVPAGHLSRGAYNKYSVHAMAHEIDRVIHGSDLPQKGLIEVAPDKWFDPQSAGLPPTDLDTALSLRGNIESATSRIRNADVVFLTLGLVESWIDNELGVPLNRAPGGMGFMRIRDRLEFVDHGFQVISECMEKLIIDIRQELNPNMKFIVTVSPVPFHTTFKKDDVIVANSVSKSILRVVADNLFRKFDFVDYFPSYEFVTMSSRRISWHTDQIHVDPKMVRHIMENFVKIYYHGV
jgi:hypothetical protein